MPTSRGKASAASLIREIQRQSGLTQAELARRAGLPRSVVNVYLRGKREPGADVLARLAAAGGFELGLAPRKPPVDPERAGKILVQVLELAEALPFRARPDLDFPRLADRLAAEPGR
ncbi:MAG TPA: helix-turn-helix transcriptional regulator [Solirubrobacterales bacterium]|nr:helix-turn-helix transcriptional regulator [Solirubrobacterales bacterium]